MITDRKEQKIYIIRNWKNSSGERIAEMLKRYWKPKKVDAFDYLQKQLKTGESL